MLTLRVQVLSIVHVNVLKSLANKAAVNNGTDKTLPTNDPEFGMDLGECFPISIVLDSVVGILDYK